MKVLYEIKFRANLKYFLEEVSKYYDLVVFTASIQEYADKICDRLEEFVVLEGRLYREHCSMTSGGQYVKDLDVFGRDDVFLLDDSLKSFLLDFDKGIYIHQWMHGINKDKDVNDKELLKVADMLVECGKTGVENIKKVMRLSEMVERICTPEIEIIKEFFFER